MSAEAIKSYCCLCWATKPILVTATIPMTAFVAGQVIPVLINIANPTKSKINDVKIQFLKLCTFKTDHPVKKCHKTKKVIHENICSVSSGTAEKFFQIPLVSPSTFNKCRIIDVSYEIHIQTKVRMGLGNLS